MRHLNFYSLFREKKNTKPIINTNTILTAACIVAASVFSSCKSNKALYEAPSVYGFKGKGMLPPPGMVYVPSGTILYKSSADNDGATRRVSLSPFFIDATEVTNKQYRDFVNWVADSIVITDYLKDDSYYLKPGKSSTSTAKYIDWSRIDKLGAPLWQSNDEAITSKIMGTLVISENGKKVLNSELLKYQLSYFQAGGENANKQITEFVKVIPENAVWVKDFPNSQMGFMAANYYDHRSYDNHPVVGVTWKQARAFADWRGKAAASQLQRNAYLKAYQLTFNLPTEAQWQYAASGVRHPEEAEGSPALSYKDRKGEKLLVNFKQGEGNYTQDGSTFTLPVKSYSPNTFGVFNMAGNVSEWTLDAFSPSAVEFVHDLNPVLLYDAADTDPVVMKRKVIRGGSWKDNAELLNIDTRNYEAQDASHSYIGFRCVMPAPELLSEQVRTRKTASKSKRSSSSEGRATRSTSNTSSKGMKSVSTKE
ncbi:SUMF1/EgtB/PvdO family nonheme iron enzyme [Pedobacter sp. SYSU D00535]|uniref:type IX secretion system lipoprotein PorK/GldK n=1 Tax=Pedobacter sp. SYSU D00535 TaxID=2810308 RepID=UPI001A96ABEF|nr:SUMF1/EgtB/PvdO family nonheme iron enzyme [Pedobacter sp. SYSU D00535]